MCECIFSKLGTSDNCQDSATMFSEQIIVAIRCGILESLTRCCQIVAATLNICHMLFFVQIITYFVLRLALVKIKKFKVTSTSYSTKVICLKEQCHEIFYLRIFWSPYSCVSVYGLDFELKHVM